MQLREIYEKYNLNREKVCFLVTLLVVGLYSAGKITGSSGKLPALQHGLLRSLPVEQPSKALTGAGDRVTEPRFDDYWDVQRNGPFHIVSDWKVLPPVKLDPPALPPLRRVLLPPLPGPGPARRDLLAREFPPHKVELPEEAKQPDEPKKKEEKKEEEQPKRNVIDEEQKKSRFYSEVRKLDQVDLQDGAIHVGRIVDEDGTSLTIELQGKKGMRLPLVRGKVARIIRRVSLEEVYDKKLAELGGGNVPVGLEYIEDCIKFGFRDVAVKHLAQMVEKNPSDPKPYLLAGRYYGQAFAYDELASLFLLAARNKVAAPELRWRQARFLARPFNAFHEKAIALYGQAIPELTGAEQREARFELAGLLQRTGELEQAKTIYRELLRGDDAARARVGLCTALLAQGQLKEALGLLEQEDAPDAASIELRGVARLLEGKTPAAIVDLQAARAADAASFSAAYNLALAYLYAGNPEPARKEFDAARSLAIGDPSMAYLGIGLVDHLAGKPDKALAEGYAAALKANSGGNAMAHYLVGLATLESKGDRAQARQSFASAVRIEFEFAEAHLRLGAMALEDGDQLAAQMHLEQAALLRPDAVAYAYLGRALAGAGQLDRAEKAYQRGLALDPASVPCKEGQAWVSNAGGQQKLAERAFRRIQSAYAKAAVAQIVENQKRLGWTDQFTRKDKDGKILRKWVETEEAGVQIGLFGQAVVFAGRQTRIDRMTELYRELPKGREFVSMAVDLDTSGAAKAHVGIHLMRAGHKGAAQGGLYFGVTPDGQIYYARYNREQPTQMNEELFSDFKLIGAAKDYLGEKGVLRIEVVRVDLRNARFMFRAGGKDLVDKPVVVNSLIRTRSVRVGLFGAAPEDTAWKLVADNVQVTSTGTGK